MPTGAYKHISLCTAFTLWSCERAARRNFLPKNSFRCATQAITLEHWYVHTHIEIRINTYIFQRWPELGTALMSEWVIISNPSTGNTNRDPSFCARKVAVQSWYPEISLFWFSVINSIRSRLHPVYSPAAHATMSPDTWLPEFCAFSPSICVHA